MKWPLRSRAASSDADTPPVSALASSVAGYTSDAAISAPEADRFERGSFAERIADTISNRKDRSPLVMAIYGRWGEGKTSVLNLLRHHLEQRDDIIVVSYDPWFFHDDNVMLESFLFTLADAIGRKLPSRKEEIGELLKIIGPGFPAVKATAFVLSAETKTGDLMKSVGESLSTVALEERRVRLEHILDKEHKRLVVFVDDIDRLDKNEMQTIFKIVKLSAGFRNTTYVLAFDPEVVANAIGENFGAGGHRAGMEFLEKIVQVPLRLPPVDAGSLLEMCFEGINRIVADAGLDLTDTDAQKIAQDFDSYVKPALTTLRVVNRYLNALAFAIPMLKGEAHPGDLMLMEAVRVFYPSLYESIRANSDVYLGNVLSFQVGQNDVHGYTKDIIEDALNGSTVKEKTAKLKLVQRLFPQVHSYFGGGAYDTIEWGPKWRSEQRVASTYYFPRYFTYAVLSSDFPDAAVGELCLSAETASVKDLASRISEDIASYSPEVWLRKLGDKTSVVSPEAASRLGVAVASCGHAFAGKHAKGDALRSLSETAASVIRELLRAVPQEDKRYESAASILDRAQPLSLAGYCLIRMARGSGEGDALFTEFEVQGLGRSLSHRICQESMGKPLYVTYPDDAKLLLSAWAKWGVPGECSGNVRSWLMKEPTDALRLLKSFAGTMLANGIRMTSNLEDSTYSTLAEVVEPQAIADALARIPDFMIDGTKNPQFEDSDLPPERILAEQFMFLHRQATNNPEQGPVEGSGDSEGASRHTPEMREADEQCASGQ